MTFYTIQEMQNEYINNNELANGFLNNHNNQALSYNSLRAFAGLYEERDQNGRRMGSAGFSERVFSYWTMRQLENNGNYTPVDIQYNHEIELRDDEDILGTVRKRFDFSFVGLDDRRIIIEFKCNIDNVEKDLYKFYLLKRENLNANRFVTALLVWEVENNWLDRNGNLGQYARLIRDAKVSGFLDEYFYFAVEDDEQNIDQEIRGYAGFLQNYRAV